MDQEQPGCEAKRVWACVKLRTHQLEERVEVPQWTLPEHEVEVYEVAWLVAGEHGLKLVSRHILERLDCEAVPFRPPANGIKWVEREVNTATTPSARCCHAASSGGRALLFDPDFNQAPDVGCNFNVREQPLKGIRRELLQLTPQGAIEDRLEDGSEQFGGAIHVHLPATTVPRPNPNALRHEQMVPRGSTDVVRRLNSVTVTHAVARVTLRPLMDDAAPKPDSASEY